MGLRRKVTGLVATVAGVCAVTGAVAAGTSVASGTWQTGQ
jgi:hypothetical protein